MYFNAPNPKAQVNNCDYMLSVVRRYLFTCSTSPLKPLNGLQRNLIESKILTSSTKFLFFWADQKYKLAALASDWLRHFRLLR